MPCTEDCLGAKFCFVEFSVLQACISSSVTQTIQKRSNLFGWSQATHEILSSYGLYGAAYLSETRRGLCVCVFMLQGIYCIQGLDCPILNRFFSMKGRSQKL